MFMNIKYTDKQKKLKDIASKNPGKKRPMRFFEKEKEYNYDLGDVEIIKHIDKKI